MQLLKDILYGVSILTVKGSTNVDVESLTFDSRLAKEGMVFIAIKGASRDGHEFIQEVCEKGCSVVVAEKEVEVPENVQLIVVEDSSKALAIMASNYYGEPSKKLKLIRVIPVPTYVRSS